MEVKKLRAAIEAVLFASGEPVAVSRMAQVLEIDKSTAGRLMQNIADEYNERGGGIRVVKLNDSYQMCTDPAYAGPVRGALELRRNVPLSQAGMEVLAIIAYNQPVTKAFVEQIRGVDCGGVVNSLMGKGLVEERGRLELPGRPLLYGTTLSFLRCLGITSLAELPPLPPKEGRTEEEPAGPASES